MKNLVANADWNDRFNHGGAVASTLCAVHCALMPLAVSFLPLLGGSFLNDPRAEWAFFALSCALAIIGLWGGVREHGSGRVAWPFASGLLLLSLGRCGEAFDWPLPNLYLLAGGGSIVAWAHWLNWKLCRACRLRSCACGCGH